jgi:hypothetical protein
MNLHGVTASPTPAAGVFSYSCLSQDIQAVDTADENLRTTNAVFGSSPGAGGGIGGNFDPHPLISAPITITTGQCINAHLSALIGSSLYGHSPFTLFEVTIRRLLPTPGPLVPMIGHYLTPYGLSSPAVEFKADGDVDTFAANFFIGGGQGHREVLGGTYMVEVWWAGGPPGHSGPPGGAIGAAVVLKLYRS